MHKRKEDTSDLIKEAEKLIRNLEKDEDELEAMTKDNVLLETVMNTKEEPQSND